MELDIDGCLCALQLRCAYVLTAAHYTVYSTGVVAVPWDAELFARAVVVHRIPVGAPLLPAPVDSILMSRFPTPELGQFERPTTVVDCRGRILIWYLPGVLDSAANVRRMPASKDLHLPQTFIGHPDKGYPGNQMPIDSQCRVAWVITMAA